MQAYRIAGVLMLWKPHERLLMLAEHLVFLVLSGFFTIQSALHAVKARERAVHITLLSNYSN